MYHLVHHEINTMKGSYAEIGESYYAMQPRLVYSSQSSCLSFLNPKITGMKLYTSQVSPILKKKKKS